MIPPTSTLSPPRRGRRPPRTGEGSRRSKGGGDRNHHHPSISWILLLLLADWARGAYFHFDPDQEWGKPIMLPWEPLRSTKNSVLVSWTNAYNHYCSPLRSRLQRRHPERIASEDLDLRNRNQESRSWYNDTEFSTWETIYEGPGKAFETLNLLPGRPWGGRREGVISFYVCPRPVFDGGITRYVTSGHDMTVDDYTLMWITSTLKRCRPLRQVDVLPPLPQTKLLQHSLQLRVPCEDHWPQHQEQLYSPSLATSSG